MTQPRKLIQCPRVKGLDRPRAAFLDEIQVPPEEAVEEQAEQLRFI